jgi:multiple sugar transport system ATP-binding protein
MSAVSLDGLTKVYATGVTALDALDLEVNQGEFVVLVGPSGCGKTTALRMVAGLEQITSGTVRFGDRVVNDVSPRQRDVAMVFQNYALYPHLTVAENIGFSLANKKVPKAERERRVRDAAAILGLTDLLNRTPRRLSGGQRQRVAMGRAIVREPAVFLMDEPLSNLDAKLRVQMRAEVMRVQRRIGATTLYVTHDQIEAMTMGDRVAVLASGRLQQYAAPRELYDAPANLFVASFVGSPAMNLYEAALEDAGDATVVVLGSQRLTLPAGPARSAGPAGPEGEGDAAAGRAGLDGYHGRKVIVGIRPEHLTSPGEAGPRAGASLKADVRLVEPLGSEQLVHFTIDAALVREDTDTPAGAAIGDSVADGQILAVPAANGVAVTGPHAPVRAGSPAVLDVDVDRLHFFDPDTHRAIAGRRTAPGPA